MQCVITESRQEGMGKGMTHMSVVDESVLAMGISEPVLNLAKEFGSLFHTEAFSKDVKALYTVCDDIVCLPDYEKHIQQKICEKKCQNVKVKETTEKLKDKCERLGRENQRLRQRTMCRKCQEVELRFDGITFVPCGHFVTCLACSETYEHCPSCGKVIMGTIKTFLS